MKDEKKYFGRDEHFNSVVVNSDDNLTGKIRYIKINHCNQNTLFGELMLNPEQNEHAA